MIHKMNVNIFCGHIGSGSSGRTDPETDGQSDYYFLLIQVLHLSIFSHAFPLLLCCPSYILLIALFIPLSF